MIEQEFLVVLRMRVKSEFGMTKDKAMKLLISQLNTPTPSSRDMQFGIVDSVTVADK